MEFIEIKIEDVISPEAFCEQNSNWLFFLSLGSNSKEIGGNCKSHHTDEYYWCERTNVEFFLKNNTIFKDGLTKFVASHKSLYEEILYKKLNSSKHRDYDLKIDSSIAFVFTKIKENPHEWDKLRSEYNNFELNKELPISGLLKKKIIKC